MLHNIHPEQPRLLWAEKAITQIHGERFMLYLDAGIWGTCYVCVKNERKEKILLTFILKELALEHFLFIELHFATEKGK